MPIDSSWIYSKNGEKLSQIALDARPVAAVVVAGTIESWLRHIFSLCNTRPFILKKKLLVQSYWTEPNLILNLILNYHDAILQ